MGFELFKEFGRGHRPTCSIRTNGQIGLNQGAIRRFSLRDGYAALFYDRDNRIIGVKPVAGRDTEGATRLIVKANNAFISAKSFLEFYAIPYRDGTRTYDAIWSDEHGMILIHTKNPIRKRRNTDKQDSIATSAS